MTIVSQFLLRLCGMKSLQEIGWRKRYWKLTQRLSSRARTALSAHSLPESFFPPEISARNTAIRILSSSEEEAHLYGEEREG